MDSKRWDGFVESHHREMKGSIGTTICAAATYEELLPQHPQQVIVDMVQTSDVTAVMERGECGGYVSA